MSHYVDVDKKTVKRSRPSRAEVGESVRVVEGHEGRERVRRRPMSKVDLSSFGLDLPQEDLATFEGMLGIVQDSVIAEKFGLPVHKVGRIRRALHKKGLDHHQRVRRPDIPQEILDQIGKRPYKDLASEAGVHPQTLRRRAIELGLDLAEGYPRGERHHAAKLTAEKVREARDLWANGTSGLSVSELARRYGVPHQTMGNALHGKTWRHLT